MYKVPLPTAQDVVGYLGQGDDPEVTTLAGAHLPVISAQVESYTRGNGFEDAPSSIPEDLAAVILGAAARAVHNPAGVIREQVATFSVTPFQGFTLAETFILNRYRKRAA